MKYKIGIGYDVHKLVDCRDLIIGGVKIDYEKGLLGHSDADVLVHAIIDSILGALGEGDIGRHFPDTDSKYKDISSMELLKTVGDLLNSKEFEISNIDSVVIAQKPKLMAYIKQMEKNISDCLGITEDKVNVKATTEEGLGFTGNGEGVAAKAVCSIYSN